MAHRYEPVLLSAEMGPYGYWLVTWSVAPGARVTITCARVGISRSEAIADSRITLGTLPAGKEAQI